MRRLLQSAVVLTACLLSGCTGSKADHTTTSTIDTTRTSTQTQTRTPPSTSFTPKPAKSANPLPPGRKPPKGEVERLCPYIASTPQENPKVNVADIEGDHVYRTTVLTGMKPVGCRFYFYSGPYEAVADITTQSFSTAAEAHDALVLTGRAGRRPEGKPNGIAHGVDAVLFQTKFFGPDDTRDWACAFAKGKVMVIVRTQQSNVSFNALELARAVAPKI